MHHAHAILLEPFFDDLACCKAVDVDSRHSDWLASRRKRCWRLESAGIGATKSPSPSHFVCFSDLVLNRDMKVGEEAVALGEPAFVVLAATDVGPVRIMVDEARRIVVAAVTDNLPIPVTT